MNDIQSDDAKNEMIENIQLPTWVKFTEKLLLTLLVSRPINFEEWLLMFHANTWLPISDDMWSNFLSSDGFGLTKQSGRLQVPDKGLNAKLERWLLSKNENLAWWRKRTWTGHDVSMHKQVNHYLRNKYVIMGQHVVCHPAVVIVGFAAIYIASLKKEKKIVSIVVTLVDCIIKKLNSLNAAYRRSLLFGVCTRLVCVQAYSVDTIAKLCMQSLLNIIRNLD